MKTLNKTSVSYTDRSNPSFVSYLKDISKIPLITPEEEVELANRIQKGDIKALHKLVNANLRFVISVAKQYTGQGIELNDLVNEGNSGLITAANKFDPSKGFRFISYAVWWIRQSILLALSKQSRTVRVPINKLNLVNKVKKFSKKFEQENERLPSINEIAEYLEFDTDSVVKLLNLKLSSISLDAPVDDNEEIFLSDVLPVEEEKENINDDIRRFLNKFDDRTHDILIMFFGLLGTQPLKYDEIGNRFNLSSERIRQLKEAAIKKIRTNYIDEAKLLL